METPTTDVPARRGWHEDWIAAFLGMVILVGALALASATRPSDFGWDAPAPPSLSAEEKQAGKERKSPWPPALKGWIGKFSTWKSDPLAAFRPKAKKSDQPSQASAAAASTGPQADQRPMAEISETTGSPPPIENPGPYQWQGIVGAFLATLVIGLIAGTLQRKTPRQQMAFVPAFVVLFALTVFSFVLAAQAVLEAANLEFALWALLVGLLVANTVGTPRWLEPAVHSELYIKIGLVLLGAEVLFSRLLALGLPGVLTSWLVTPVVLISTYVFGQKILKMQSKSLNLVISADMSVCGVSAAIATAAACKAKKEELSLAIGLSLLFTVVMMVFQPMVIEYFHMDPVVGGAWLGGTIDSTGAVAAAAHSKYLGAIGLETAVTVKMIQNILIGVTAICVAVYWTRWVEPKEHGGAVNVGPGEIWRRFPKFVIGFVAASLLASILFASSYYGELWLGSAVDGITKQLRTWLFGLAFVCIGLETNFRQLLPYLRSGKPLALYLCGQALNLLLSLLMATLMFGWLFPPATGAP